MLFYTVGQAQVFLSMWYVGMALGLWYGCCAWVRRRLEAGFVISAAVDLTFSAGTVLMIGAALWRANYLDLRLYALLGTLCGWLLYAVSLGPLLRWALGGARRWAGKIKSGLMRRKLVQKILK